jgi:hypothetical protein
MVEGGFESEIFAVFSMRADIQLYTQVQSTRYLIRYLSVPNC